MQDAFGKGAVSPLHHLDVASLQCNHRARRSRHNRCGRRHSHSLQMVLVFASACGLETECGSSEESQLRLWFTFCRTCFSTLRTWMLVVRLAWDCIVTERKELKRMTGKYSQCDLSFVRVCSSRAQRSFQKSAVILKCGCNWGVC